MLEHQRESSAKAKGDYKGRSASIDAAEIRRLTATTGPAAIAARHRAQPRLPAAGTAKAA
jgi:hypothetical protein